jgi:acetyl-CoA acyltransferase
MKDVVIVDAVRTPIGRFRGALAGIRADHLATTVLNALVRRSSLDPGEVGDVVFGCVTQVGEQCGNIARTALLSAGWPETVPGMTIDRKCGSGEAAVHVAYGLLASGVVDVIVAGGAENMSRVPMGGNRDVHGQPFGHMLESRFNLVSQGEAAELISDRWGLSREDHDRFALTSHERAAHAADSGWFVNEMVPVAFSGIAENDFESALAGLDGDETIRRGTSMDKLAGLKAVFRPDHGRVTAGNASQISDGAAALLLMSADQADRLGLRPRARIVNVAVVGSDPELMLTGPIEATRKVLSGAGLKLDQIDLFEVNEAFASAPLIWMKELGVDHAKLNVNGGAIALGHPLGASGARIMSTLLNELERRDLRYGLQTICCAGGLGTATIIERLS